MMVTVYLQEQEKLGHFNHMDAYCHRQKPLAATDFVVSVVACQMSLLLSLMESRSHMKKTAQTSAVSA